jgi:hypothetical protein
MTANRAALLLCALLAAGCGARKVPPSGQVELPGGEFVYTAPADWKLWLLPGTGAPVSEGKVEYGIAPNLFVDGVTTGTLDEAAAQVVSRYARQSQQYEEQERRDFLTDSGLPGTRITVRRMSSNGIPLVSIHYLVRHGNRVATLTATCAGDSFPEAEPLFDAAMRSLTVTSTP